MSKVKKLILGLGVAVGMAIAFVVGLVGINQGKSSKVLGSNVNGEQEYVAPKVEFEQSKPATITHAPNEIKVQKGGDDINYSYQPDNNSKDNAKTVAYEYCFGSTVDAMAVDVKAIGDTTGVDISYIYSDTEIDTESIQTSHTRYDIQKINSGNKWKYIYIVVSAQDEVPTEFSHSIEWYFGKAGEVTIANNFDNSTSTLLIVKGAEMQQPADLATLSNGYNFMGWYLDKNCTTPATFPRITSGLTLYAKFPNLPTDYLAWDSATSSYYVKRGSATLPENLIIPANYNDGTNGLANVTYIHGTSSSDGAFGSKTTLKSADLPSTTTSIGNYAFYYCSELTSIDLSGCTGLTSIGNYAFGSCSGLTSITLSGCTSLTSIEYAFYGCSGLTSVTLPTGLTSIKYAFYYCSELTSIDLSGCISLTSIGNQAFRGCIELTSIVIPASVTSIGNYAFYECRGLTSITLPSSLTSIGSGAFSHCSGLTSIDLSGCTSLTSIGNSAFSACYGLTNIVIPANITSIGSGAFSNCSSLAEVYNLSSLNITLGGYNYGYVGRYAKAIYTSLDEPTKVQTINDIYYYVHEEYFIAMGPVSRDITSVTIDTRTTEISLGAFRDCNKLTEIDLSSLKINSINDNTFENCTELISVILPSNLGTIQQSAFSNCIKLTDITLPDGLTYISHAVFSNSGITSITIPASVTSIYGGTAFLGCDSLEKIVVESGNTVYDSRNNCNAIIETRTNKLIAGCINTVIPNDITSIGFSAFHTCRELTSIVIPSSVTKIGYQAFYGCTNLTSITFEDTTSTWYYTSSSNYTNGTEIDVTDASANATYFKSTYYDKYWYKV